MFDFFRKHNKIVMVFLFLLIIPSFIWFGVGDRYDKSNRGEKVASVDGHDITRPEWEQQHRVEVDRIRQQNPNVDVAMFDTDAAKYATLERLVRDRVLQAAAANTHMTVSEDKLARVFAADQGLAMFRGADGKFDRALFQRATQQTPEQYEASVRAGLATQQVLGGVAASAFATKAQADATLNAFYDRREVQVARFNPTDFASKVTVSDADLDAWYKDHKAQFQAPEQADVEYVVLDLDSVKKNIAVSEADLKTYYEQNKARFGTKEERRASHILITAPASAPAADREKAKAKAEQLLAEVKKSPASFADIARKNSQDPGSAEKGGDLDFVKRDGTMVKPFEDAMFSLKKGEISGLVETEFGYHIIEVTDIKPETTPSFEQVRTRMEDEARAQMATQEFAKAAESFTDMVFQQPDSLQPVADKFKLKIQTATDVARTPPATLTGPLANRKFLDALYAADTRERKHNTEAVEVGPSQLASGRMTKYMAARTLEFAEVKDKVRTALIAERAGALAKAEGEAKLKAWQADAAGAKLTEPVTISRLEPQSLPAPVVEGALRADTTKLPAWAGVDIGAQGYVVVRVNKVVPREAPKPEQAAQEIGQFSQIVSSAESNAYYELLKQRYKAEISVPKPAAATQ
ncbi:SurA N-terminal domain-containing protein [Variovorax rhizosphaerae]|uniref:Periplasmic chaperone PpiD n=1 Tax=Variovorax rhizosphaerae TaxID=1836200 RepID=A0ABU8WQX3_9BURK